MEPVVATALRPLLATDALVTVTETAGVTVVFPAASLATAVKVCVPAVTPVVFHTIEYGAVVSSAPTFVPSTLNWTPATPTLSDAFAESVTDVPAVTEVPETGEVRETEGAGAPGVSSGGRGGTGGRGDAR